MRKVKVALIGFLMCLAARPAMAQERGEQDQVEEIELGEDEVAFCDSMNHLIDAAVLNFDSVKGETIEAESAWLSSLELPGTYESQISKTAAGSMLWQAEAITTSDEEQATFEYNRLAELLGNCSISMAKLSAQETVKGDVSSTVWSPAALSPGYREAYKNIRIKVEMTKSAEMTDDVGLLDMYRVFLYVENIAPKAN